MTPCTVLPYMVFSPNAPQALSVSRSGSDSNGKVSSSFADLDQLCGLVGGDADDVQACAVQLGQVVAEVAGPLGTAGVLAAG